MISVSLHRQYLLHNVAAAAAAVTHYAPHSVSAYQHYVAYHPPVDKLHCNENTVFKVGTLVLPVLPITRNQGLSIKLLP
jgi:hypothetical protein